MKAKFVKNTLFEFERGRDLKQVMKIGEKAKINDWFSEMHTEEKIWAPEKPEYTINGDLSIDIEGSFQLPWGESIPDFIKFKNIYGSFTIKQNQNINNLDFFPEYISGDLEFYGNGIKLTEKKLREMGVEVKGHIIIASPKDLAKMEYKKRYRKRGSLADRTSHKLSDLGSDAAEYGPKFSQGYKLYNALKAIRDAEPEGLRYVDILRFLHDLSHGKGDFDPVRDRGRGSAYFSAMGKSNSTPIKTRTKKTSSGRYILNDKGREHLEEYKDIFED